MMKEAVLLAEWRVCVGMLETMDEFDRRDIGEDYVLVYFDRETQTVYAAFHYWGW